MFSLLFSRFVRRNPAIWNQPEEFIPERFLDPEANKIQTYAYLPFVTGPHKCLGHQFAKMQMKLVVARLVSTFEFRKPEGMQFKRKMRLTLRAEPPVTLQVKRCEFKRPEVEYPQV